MTKANREAAALKDAGISNIEISAFLTEEQDNTVTRHIQSRMAEYNPDHHYPYDDEPPTQPEKPADWEGYNKPATHEEPVPSTEIMAPPTPVHEKPADWDGKNTYNPDHHYPYDDEPPTQPEKPADWEGYNKPATHEEPVPSTEIMAPPTPEHEKPADWDGKNTYNPDHHYPYDDEPPTQPEKPADWEGYNKPATHEEPVPSTEIMAPPTPEHEKPADWDGKNTYNPQHLDIGKVLDLDNNEIDHLLVVNFGPKETHASVSTGPSSEVPSATPFPDDDSHLTGKTSGDFGSF